MVKNFVIKNRHDALIKEKRELALKKKANEELIVNWKRQKHEILKLGNSLPDAFLKEKSDYVQQNAAFDSRMTVINAELAEINSQKDTDENIGLLKIFREIFSGIQLQEIYDENRRRIAGEPPLKISFNWKECEGYKTDAARYKKLAKEQMEKMIEFRLALTGLIEKGCTQFGQGEFLKFISPLNTLIIPVDELRKIKQKNFL